MLQCAPFNVLWNLSFKCEKFNWHCLFQFMNLSSPFSSLKQKFQSFLAKTLFTNKMLTTIYRSRFFLIVPKVKVSKIFASKTAIICKINWFQIDKNIGLITSFRLYCLKNSLYFKNWPRSKWEIRGSILAVQVLLSIGLDPQLSLYHFTLKYLCIVYFLKLPGKRLLFSAELFFKIQEAEFTASKPIPWWAREGDYVIPHLVSARRLPLHWN